MSCKIPNFFYESSQDVCDLSENFLKKHKLNYFQLCSMYNDGSHSFLVTRPDFVKARYDRNLGVRSSIRKEQKDFQKYIFLWNGNLPDEDTNMAREFNIDNGICFVERYSDRYNLIAFGAPSEEKGILDFYLNHVETLRDFTREFSDRGKNLILASERKRFKLTESLRDINEQSLYWNRTRYFNFLGRDVILSVRESECLRLWMCGHTMLEISDVLKISSRTVETYLERMKIKLGIENKKELMKQLLSSNLNF